MFGIETLHKFDLHVLNEKAGRSPKVQGKVVKPTNLLVSTVAAPVKD